MSWQDFRSFLPSHRFAARMDGRQKWHKISQLRQFLWHVTWLIRSQEDRDSLLSIHRAVNNRGFPLDLRWQRDGHDVYVVAVHHELYDWLSSFTPAQLDEHLSAYYAYVTTVEPVNNQWVLDSIPDDYRQATETWRARLTACGPDIHRVYLQEAHPPLFLAPTPSEYNEDEWNYPKAAYFGGYELDFNCSCWGIRDDDDAGLRGMTIDYERGTRSRNKDEARTAQTRADELARAEADGDSFQYMEWARAQGIVWIQPSFPLPAIRFVYFLTDGDLVKIGKSNDIRNRLNALATGSPKPLQLVGIVPGGRDVEKAIHGKLHSRRQNGEWFKLSTTEAVKCILEHGGMLAPESTAPMVLSP